MSTVTKVLIAVFLSLFLLLVASGIWFVASYVSASNYANTAEQGIIAQHTQLKNISSNTSARVMEMLQIPKMYKDDLVEVVQATFEGRYGSDGSQAVMQWIQEQNINYDSSMFNRVQQSIEAGRNEFMAAQTRFITTKQVYITNTGYVVKGFFISMAGYPKINLDEYNIIIISDTKNKFDSGVDEVMQLRQNIQIYNNLYDIISHPVQ